MAVTWLHLCEMLFEQGKTAKSNSDQVAISGVFNSTNPEYMQILCGDFCHKMGSLIP